MIAEIVLESGIELLNETEGTFNVVSFLEKEQAEFLETHYANGVKRFKYRTRSEKKMNCRRIIGWTTGPDGAARPFRENPCHIITGDDPCVFCSEVRNYKRGQWLNGRIDNLVGVPLYYLELSDSADANRLRASCSYHGYKHLSVPVDEDGRKFVLVDGPVRGSVPISLDEAKQKVASASAFMSPERRVRVGGSLGVDSSDDNNAANKHKNSVDVSVNVFGFYGNEPSPIEISRAHVLSMVVVGEKTEVTIDSIQSVFSNRQQKVMETLSDFGYSPYIKMTKLESFDPDVISSRWTEIVIRQPEVTGHVSSLDGITRMVMGLSIDELKRVARNDSDMIIEIMARATSSIE